MFFLKKGGRVGVRAISPAEMQKKNSVLNKTTDTDETHLGKQDDTALLPNTVFLSVHSYPHPTSRVEGSVPLNDSRKPTNADNQPTVLGIHPFGMEGA